MRAPAGQRQLAEQPLVLRLLRVGHRTRVVAVEQRRRIRHRRVEPQPVEVVAEVVVRDDVAARLPPRVGVQVVLEAQQRARPPVPAERALERRLVRRQHREELREIRRVPAAVDVALGERDVAALQRVGGDLPVAELQDGRHAARVRRGRAARPERAARAVGRHQFDGAVGEAREQRDQHPRGGGHAGGGSGQRGVEGVMSCASGVGAAERAS